MTQFSRDGANSGLLSEAVAALRELTSRAREVHDRSFDDDHSVDFWQSDELHTAIKRAEAVIVKRMLLERRIETEDSRPYVQRADAHDVDSGFLPCPSADFRTRILDENQAPSSRKPAVEIEWRSSNHRVWRTPLLHFADRQRRSRGCADAAITTGSRLRLQSPRSGRQTATCTRLHQRPWSSFIIVWTD